jgi:hypothetical protein
MPALDAGIFFWRGQKDYLKIVHIVLAREAGEEGTQTQSDWGGEGVEVKAPSSIPSCFAGQAPFFSRFTGEDIRASALSIIQSRC